MSFITKHFRRYARLKPWAFCWRITLEGLAISLLVGVVLQQIVHSPERELTHWDPVFAFLVIVIGSPIIETLIFQFLPIAIARRFRARLAIQMIVSTLLFAAAHFPEGIATGVAAGLVGGFYFAFTFVRWRKRSRWTACWTTGLSHSLHNLAAFVIILAMGGFSSGGGLEYNAAGGGGVGSCWYFYTGEGEFRFAICGENLHSLWGGGMSARVFRDFSIEVDGRAQPFVYTSKDHSLRIEGGDYDLTRGNVFWVTPTVSGLSVQQKNIQIGSVSEAGAGLKVMELIHREFETKPMTQPASDP